MSGSHSCSVSGSCSSGRHSISASHVRCCGSTRGARPQSVSSAALAAGRRTV
jgi:hypothetical protein